MKRIVTRTSNNTTIAKKSVSDTFDNVRDAAQDDIEEIPLDDTGDIPTGDANRMIDRFRQTSRDGVYNYRLSASLLKPFFAKDQKHPST